MLHQHADVYKALKNILYKLFKNTNNDSECLEINQMCTMGLPKLGIYQFIGRY